MADSREQITSALKMKEHMRSYFPARFEDSDARGLANKAFSMMSNAKVLRTNLKCRMRVDEVFEQSDELRLLAGAMKKFGCLFDLERHTSCEPCIGCHGGFDPDTNQIIICNNASLSMDRIMATMMHEMIHMFDYCRMKFDFNNLEHVACSEIRAANLTYCSITDRISHGGPGVFNFKKTHQYCVKDVAFQSTKAYSPETSDETLWNIIDKVFPGCYNDLEPFGRRPTAGIRELKHSYRERYRYGYLY